MRTRTWIWLSLAATGAALCALLAWQHVQGLAGQAERGRLIARQLTRASARVPSRNETAELARLRRQHDEWLQAREMLAKAERALANLKAGLRVEPAARKSSEEGSPPLAGPMVKNADWRNAGAASPEAALESFVWAATRGETEVLAGLLAVDEAGRRKLAEVFGQLSDEARAAYASPEGMLATLAAVQVPQDLSAIGLVNRLPLSNGDIALRTRLERGGAIAKDASLVFRLADGRWQLVVPREIAVAAVTAAAKSSPAIRR